MAEKKKSSNIIKEVSFRIAKATTKAILVYLMYFLLAPLLAPLFELVPGVMESIEAFVAVYITLMIISDVAARTIFEHIFRTARAVFFMGYLILSLGNGVISTSYQNFSLTLDLKAFTAIALSLSLLNVATAILQVINFLNSKAEADSDTSSSQ
ncbi:MAG: hypothetical protein N3E52_02855 [Candidatus Bathyarchaeota archaeon]|nr:hypothetical protein [Candidatus Bathyarchaeota archaeon]